MERLIKGSFFICYMAACIGIDTCQAQVFTSNDGFEGFPSQGTPPPNWNNCDMYSTVDTQPGSFNNYAAASQGQTYISMVTREFNPIGTVETTWSNLLVPFEINKCYSLSLDISLSHDFYGTLNGINYYFDNPCVLQIFGFNGSCSSPQTIELLWESNVLNNFNWQSFNVVIQPITGTFNRIAIKPMFSPLTNFKNSAVFVDNIRYGNTPVELTCDSGFIVLPAGSTGIQWYFNNQVIPGAYSNFLFPYASGNYSAAFYDANGCFTMGSVSLTANDTCVCPCDDNSEPDNDDDSELEYWVNIFNVFSPNGDTFNDEFLVVGENIKKMELKIFNRWGSLVFETNDKNEPWTGRDRNGEYPDGVYYYIAEILFMNDKTFLKHGNVTLMR